MAALKEFSELYTDNARTFLFSCRLELFSQEKLATQGHSRKRYAVYFDLNRNRSNPERSHFSLIQSILIEANESFIFMRKTSAGRPFKLNRKIVEEARSDSPTR